MKKSMKFNLLALMLLGNWVMSYAGNGIRRSEWDCGPEISVANVIYGQLAGIALPLIYGEDRPYWAPNIIYKGYLAPSLNFSSGTYDREQHKMVGRLDGTAKKNGVFDPNLKNFSVGYAVNYMSKKIPVGFSAKLAYEQTGFDAEMRNEDGYIGDEKFRRQMIVPEFLLLIRIGSYLKSATIFTINLGGCYDYVIGAKSMSYSGRETLNSGVTGIVGFNWGDPAGHFQVGALYYIPSYNYFNRDYTPDGGTTYPLNNKYWSASNALSFYVRLGF